VFTHWSNKSGRCGSNKSGRCGSNKFGRCGSNEFGGCGLNKFGDAVCLPFSYTISTDVPWSDMKCSVGCAKRHCDPEHTEEAGP
jgi:hypothetical protein